MQGTAEPRFKAPIDNARPRGKGRFELWAPKLDRRLTLFDPLQVQLWTLLESDPRVSQYCERPAYWHHDAGKRLVDFWVQAGRRESCWVLSAETNGPQPARRRAGILSPGVPVAVRLIDAELLRAQSQWIENWLRILPYLAANARHVDPQLLADAERAATKSTTLGAVERKLHPRDIVLIRTAVFMLLHRGRIKAEGLRRRPLGPGLALGARVP